MKFFNIRALTKGKIAIVIAFTFIINILSTSMGKITDNFDKPWLQSPFTENILIQSSSASFMFVIYVFIVAGLMYADAFVVDKKTGLKNIIFTKMPWKKYVRKTLIYNFFIGGLFAIIPVVVNILMWFCLRANVPLVYFNTMGIVNENLFSKIFMDNKILFFILHIIKIFLIGGILSNFALYVNTRFNNKFMGLVLGYIVDLLSIIVASLFNNLSVSVSFSGLLESSAYRPDCLTLLNLLLFVVPVIVYFRRFSNKEDLI